MGKDNVKKRWTPALAVMGAFGLLTILICSPAMVEGIDMPETIVIKYIQNQYGPVTFNHALHTTFAGSCGTCHHQHDDKARKTCSECHTVKPEVFKASVKQGFLPCSGCHTDYSSDSPEMPSLKVALHRKCFECHVGIRELGSSPGGCVKTCHQKISADKK